MLSFDWLLDRPYGNEVILRGQKIPLKCCQPLDFWYTSLKGLDLSMLENMGSVRQMAARLLAIKLKSGPTGSSGARWQTFS